MRAKSLGMKEVLFFIPAMENVSFQKSGLFCLFSVGCVGRDFGLLGNGKGMRRPTP